MNIPKQQKKMGKNPSFFIGGEDRVLPFLAGENSRQE